MIVIPKNSFSKKWLLLLLVLPVLVVIGCCIIVFHPTSDNNIDYTKACPPLPSNFKESDLVGTWIGHYFSNIDKLIIRADGTYKQIYSSDPPINFESDWQKWWLESNPNGYALLHMQGMRRCDGTDTECNNSGGGLPYDSLVINPCKAEDLHLTHEVILFVTGYAKPIPRGIILRQARLAGSDWTYGFFLDEYWNTMMP